MVFAGRPETTTTSKWIVIMPRLLWQIGVPKDEIKDFLVEEDVKAVADAYDWGLRPRKGFQEMLQTLRDGGIKFKALSSADPKKIKHFFKSHGDLVPEEDVVDSTGKGGKKPQIEPYEWTYKKWKAEQPDEELVFAGKPYSSHVPKDKIKLTSSFACMGHGWRPSSWLPDRPDTGIRGVPVRRRVGQVRCRS